jgi:hypothetical protein
MNKPLLLSTALLLFFSSFAQYGSGWKQPSKESRAYREQREKISDPCFGYDNVLLAKIIEDKEGNQSVDKKTYQ